MYYENTMLFWRVWGLAEKKIRYREVKMKKGEGKKEKIKNRLKCLKNASLWVINAQHFRGGLPSHPAAAEKIDLKGGGIGIGMTIS